MKFAQNDVAVEVPLNERIESQVMSKLRGRLRTFSVDLVSGRLVLRGEARSYHVKQLAQHEVMEMTDRPILSNRIRVVT
jgi:osmotically-inducible protein OsmY